MKNDEKTNVMRLLESKKILYTAHTYSPDPSLSGEDIARILGEDPAFVFKTLVTRGKTGRYYVFVIPVAAELDLKKAARASGEKAVSMIPQKELLPLTGLSAFSSFAPSTSPAINRPRPAKSSGAMGANFPATSPGV